MKKPIFLIEDEKDDRLFVTEIVRQLPGRNKWTWTQAAEAPKGKKVQYPAIHITAKRIGDCAEIILKDNGPGIADKIKDSLFDAFVTADRSQATGLGLAIVKQNMLAHRL